MMPDVISACLHMPLGGKENVMNAQTPKNGSGSKMAGGIFIVIGLILGIIFGISIGQISLGMISGFAIGCGVAVLIWIIDHGRQKHR